MQCTNDMTRLLYVYLILFAFKYQSSVSNLIPIFEDYFPMLSHYCIENTEENTNVCNTYI